MIDYLSNLLTNNLDDIKTILDIAIGVACAESLKYFVIKLWDYVDHHHKTPLDVLDIEEK